MFFLLEDYYFKNRNESSLASLLGDLNPNLFSDGLSADPAAYYDWSICVNKSGDNDMLRSDDVLIGIQNFLIFYQNRFGFNLSNVIEHIKKTDVKAIDRVHDFLK